MVISKRIAKRIMSITVICDNYNGNELTYNLKERLIVTKGFLTVRSTTCELNLVKFDRYFIS